MNPGFDFVCDEKKLVIPQTPDDSPIMGGFPTGYPILRTMPNKPVEVIRLLIPPNLVKRKIYAYFRGYSVVAWFPGTGQSAQMMEFVGKVQFFLKGMEVANIPITQADSFIDDVLPYLRGKTNVSFFPDTIQPKDNYLRVPAPADSLFLAVDNSFFNLQWNHQTPGAGSDFNLRGHESQTVAVTARDVEMIADTVVLSITKTIQVFSYRIFLGILSN